MMNGIVYSLNSYLWTLQSFVCCFMTKGIVCFDVCLWLNFVNKHFGNYGNIGTFRCYCINWHQMQAPYTIKFFFSPSGILLWNAPVIGIHYQICRGFKWSSLWCMQPRKHETGVTLLWFKDTHSVSQLQFLKTKQ